MQIDQTLEGKHLLVIGATGFLGKVLLGTLLRNVPTIGVITCLVRPGRDGTSAAERFRTTCWTTPPLAPMQHLMDKVVVYEGDVTQPTLGLTPTTAEAIANQCDLVINVAGLVNFNPPLAEAFGINVLGAKHVAQFTAACRHAKLIHISTCFVTGCRDGDVPETGPTVDWCPKHPSRVAGRRSLATPDTPRASFDHAREIATLQSLLGRATPEQATATALARAQIHGWPNIYTYTKALGEQVAAATLKDAVTITGAHVAPSTGKAGGASPSPPPCGWLEARTRNSLLTIVRPGVVESAVAFPEPGWNEGMNTSAPIIYLGLLGQARFPCGDGVILDVTPVDEVANAIGLISAAALRGEAKAIYQLGSSDTNPFLMAETIELTGLFKRQYLSAAHSRELAKGLGMPNWLRSLMAQWEGVPVSAAHFRRYSAPGIRAAIERIRPWLATAAKTGPLPVRAVAGPLNVAGKALHNLAARSEKVFVQYLPFIHDHVFRFQTAHIRALRAQLTPEERTVWRWAPEAIDWRRYWIDIHLAGLVRHVFPQMTARLTGKEGRPLIPHLSFLVPMPIPEGLRVRNIRLPRPARALMKWGLGRAQAWLYTSFFRTTVTGRGHIPHHRNVLVVANHSSHLDMGLVKCALGAYGAQLRALAAQDYFFRDGIRRIYFGNLTNLIPIDRSADLHESLRPALTALQRGEVVLMFPEGTRTLTGTMGRFKRGVGYLALTAGVDVLPIHLTGTFSAVPKGCLLVPQQRALGARIGPPILHTTLQDAVAGLAPDEAYRTAAAMIEAAVQKLSMNDKEQAIRRALPADGAGRGAIVRPSQ